MGTRIFTFIFPLGIEIDLFLDSHSQTRKIAISSCLISRELQLIKRQPGYVAEAGPLPSGAGRRAYLDRLVNITLVQPRKHLSLELQWDISNRFSNVPIILEDMEDRIELVELNDRSVPSLPVEELLCYLCLHGTKHRWLYLDLVCCVAELIRARKDIDWQFTGQYARKIHCSNVLLLGLFLARGFLSAELPDYINSKINKTEKIEKLAEIVYDSLFLIYSQTMVTPEKFDTLLFQVKDRLSDKIFYCLKILFIPSKEDI